jgi:hypothetical protein
VCYLHGLVEVFFNNLEKERSERKANGGGGGGEKCILASLKTMKGLFPPSSRVTRFKLLFADA